MKKLTALLLALATALALTACGGSTPSDSTGGKEFKVGIVNYVDDASLNQIIRNLQQRLDELGAELGVTFNYADYCDNAQADTTVLNQIGANMVADQVDVIVAVATPTALTMRSATEDTDIPILFAAVSDPVGAGLVDSLEAPGGRITGTSDALNTRSIVELMLLTMPDMDSVGLLYDAGQDSSTAPIAEAKAIFAKKGIAVVEKTGTNTDEVLLAAQALCAEGVDAVFTPTDNTVMAAQLSIYEVFTQAGIPHFGGADSFALWGAFCGFGVDYADLGRKTADMVADVLVNGADPAALPVATFDNGKVSVNTETCTALGYDLESIREAFSAVATEFIELTTQLEFDQ